MDEEEEEAEDEGKKTQSKTMDQTATTAQRIQDMYREEEYDYADVCLFFVSLNGNAPESHRSNPTCVNDAVHTCVCVCVTRVFARAPFISAKSKAKRYVFFAAAYLFDAIS